MSMIPQRMLELVPLPDRDSWADQIVEIFQGHNPTLYLKMGLWTFLPEEENDNVMKEILFAAEKIHAGIRNES